MSIGSTIVEKAVEFAYKHFGATQLCWVCIVLTAAGGTFIATRYATANEVAILRSDVAELKGDNIAKRVFDYKVRLCDTPREQRQEKRWLSEQIRLDIEKYFKATGSPFVPPSCEDL